MKNLKFISKKYLKSSLLILAGLLLGWLFFHNSGPTENTDQANIHKHSEAETTIWTCAMHPQIRMDKPGQCPICGMDLIPLQKSDAEIDDQAIIMSTSAMKLAEVQTSFVGKGMASKEVLLYGKIQADEQLLQSQTAHVSGRIEQLFLNVTGETVKKGQLIARIYSPELVTAQKELLETLSMEDKYPAFLEAAREKLRNWKLSEQQILDIEKSGKVTSTFDIHANTSGIVTSLNVNEGDYIGKGAVLFEVADLSKVWAVFDAYESDLYWVSLGQKVEFTSQAIPGKTFEGKVSFIDPVINPATRITGVRVELSNSGLQLKPEMFVNGMVKSNITKAEQYLAIPRSAILWTGPRSIVYVKIPGTEMPTFKMREITLGASMKDSYIVLDGLEEGEEIVTNGTFSVDAAAQLAGKPSMMNPAGGQTSTMPGMEMGNIDKKITDGKHKAMSEESKVVNTDPAFKIQLTNIYNAYLKMKDAFVATDAIDVSTTAMEVKKAIKGVDTELLKGDARNTWLSRSEELEKSIISIGKLTDIEAQRIEFARFNSTFYKILKTFGLKDNTAYYQYCPMAFENKGAYWISESKEIRNPYFGDMMLKCGENRDTIK